MGTVGQPMSTQLPALPPPVPCASSTPPALGRLVHSPIVTKSLVPQVDESWTPAPQISLYVVLKDCARSIWLNAAIGPVESGWFWSSGHVGAGGATRPLVYVRNV